MTKEMKKFLRRMIDNGGFIAKGVYCDNPRYWHSNTHHSSNMMDIVLFHQLKVNGYIKQDRTGKYLPTELGIRFATPWYKRIFNGI